MKKTCKKCNIEKNIDEFNINKSAKDGRHGQCIICHRKLQLSIYKKHMEDPEYRERERLRSAARNLKKSQMSLPQLLDKRQRILNEVTLIDSLIKKYTDVPN